MIRRLDQFISLHPRMSKGGHLAECVADSSLAAQGDQAHHQQYF
jgi:hypothetical protein